MVQIPPPPLGGEPARQRGGDFKGGRGWAEVGVRGSSFVSGNVATTAACFGLHVGLFRKWANQVGLLLEPSFVPYLQLARIPLTQPSCLQRLLHAYSVQSRGVPAPPPSCMSYIPWGFSLETSWC